MVGWRFVPLARPPPPFHPDWPLTYNIHNPTKHSYTPFLVAVGHGHTQAARLLLQHLTSNTSSSILAAWMGAGGGGHSSSSSSSRESQALGSVLALMHGGHGGSSSQEGRNRARAVVNQPNARTGETPLWLAVHEASFFCGGVGATAVPLVSN